MVRKYKPYLLIFWTVVLLIASVLAVESTIVIIGAAFVPILLLVSFLWASRWDFRKCEVQNRFVVASCLLIVLTVALTHWPLRLHYVLVGIQNPGLPKFSMFHFRASPIIAR